jgi:hypothetical protein
VDEELKQRVLSYMDATERMVSSEMPLVAQEYLNWQWYSSVGVGAASAAWCVLAFACIRVLLKWREREGVEEEAIFAGVSISSALLFFGLFILALNIENAAKVAIAPRVVLLEKVADLIGGDK